MNNSDSIFLASLTRYMESVLEQGLERAEKNRPRHQFEGLSEEMDAFQKAWQPFIEQILEANQFQKVLASGDISVEMGKKNVFAMPLKGLQANLRHLVWQARQVAQGDLNQQVHFLGEFA